jgi:hypothetical protein
LPEWQNYYNWHMVHSRENANEYCLWTPWTTPSRGRGSRGLCDWEWAYSAIELSTWSATKKNEMMSMNHISKINIRLAYWYEILSSSCYITHLN